MRYRFADFEVDSDRFELRRGDALVVVQPKVMAFVLFLLEHRDRLVGKEELLEALWPGVIVGDGSLTRIVSLARSALGEKAHSSHIVETVRGRGYRIAVPVEAEPSISATGEATFGETASLIAGSPGIAVLAFDNLSGDPSQEYFADGMAEDLITQLSSYRDLAVIARRSSFAYKGRAMDLVEIGRQLRVRYLVEGSVRRSEDRVRLAVRLVDAATGHELWSSRYDRELGGLLELQDEIAETIATSIRPELLRVERQRAIRRQPENLDAWDCVQRAAWHVLRFTKADTKEAMGLLELALELDPAYARAHITLAYAHFVQLYSGWSGSPEESLEVARRAAQRALALDEKDPMAHSVLGWTYSFVGDNVRAARLHERALKISPSLWIALWGLGVALTGNGQPDQGVAMIEKVIRLSPHDPSMPMFLQNLGIAHLLAGRYEDGIECANRILELTPEQPAAYRLLAACCGHLGQLEESRTALVQAHELAPDFTVERLRMINVPAIADCLIDGWRKGGWQETSLIR